MKSTIELCVHCMENSWESDITKEMKVMVYTEYNTHV